ncbi:hypothetical protein [Adlercreutzia sp. ZJ304]|uniref:hypothetical protein n=1 Tax=Adlercreutzia sp. ZJ304 TaxID=2709791 RepID=UPI0013E9D1B6|nr:hypothetical protein [Adlercreutzia sp. ZJ304]
MKKTSKLIGALGLSAALIVGTALPAFAVDELSDGILEKSDNPNIDNTTSSTETTGSADTTVKLSAVNTQIKATVPVQIAAYGTIGGGALITPREYAYTITNECDNSAKLYLTGIDATLLSDTPTESTGVYKVDWTASDKTELSAAGAQVTPQSNTVDASVVGGTSGSNATLQPEYGSVYVQLTAGQLSSKYNNDADTTNDGKTYKEGKKYIDYGKQTTVKLIHTSNYSTENNVNIEMDSKDTEGAQIGLRLEGYNSQLTGLEPDKLIELMKITYTVQASAAYVGDMDMHTTDTNFDYVGKLA